MKQLLCLLLTLTVFFAGCGTIIHGKYQTVPVSSNPIGAEVRSSSGQTCICPCELTLLRANEYILVATLDGYGPQQQNLGKDTSGWFWSNIILGGIIGGVIDKASGSGDKLVPAKIHFDLGTGKVFGAKDVKSKLVEIIRDPNELEGMPQQNHVAKLKNCANCENVIGNLENAYTFNNNIVCRMCNEKLTKQAKAN